MISDSVVYPSGWQRHGNIYSFPKYWQTPVKTEQYAFERLIAADDLGSKVQYICFPWATLIDCLNKKRADVAEKLIQALAMRPPKIGVSIVTICQHINAPEMLPFFEKLGITDLFWSHKTTSSDSLGEIRLHSYPLYPVAYFSDYNDGKFIPLNKRKYLYSFIGTYDPELYLDDSRSFIFNLPSHPEGLVVRRKEWHFEQEVYRKQVGGFDLFNEDVDKKNEKEYVEVMKDSVFCLCPSGSGPNSIRLWEAVAYGCIPVLFDDNYDFGKLSNFLPHTFSFDMGVGAEGFYQQLQARKNDSVYINDVSLYFQYHIGLMDAFDINFKEVV